MMLPVAQAGGNQCVRGASGGAGPTQVTIGSTNYLYHRITAVGTTAFSFTKGIATFNYLIVAGGGGSGGRHAGGGGGGGALEGNVDLVANTTYNAVVGDGGTFTAFSGYGGHGNNGGNSSLLDKLR